MTSLEQDLRAALRDMAQQSRATPLLGPVLRRHEVLLRRRRLTVALAAAVALVAGRSRGGSPPAVGAGPRMVPMQRPPTVLRTSLEATSATGPFATRTPLAAPAVQLRAPVECDTDTMAEGSPTSCCRSPQIAPSACAPART